MCSILLFLIGLLEYDLALPCQIRNFLVIAFDFLNQIVHRSSRHRRCVDGLVGFLSELLITRFATRTRFLVRFRSDDQSLRRARDFVHLAF